MSAALLAPNPLIKPDYRIPFDQIKAEQVEPAIAELLSQAERKRQAYVNSPGPRTYENTLAALEDITDDLGRTMSVLHHLQNVAATPGLRKAHEAVLPKVSAFTSSIALDAGIYAKLREYAATPEAAQLTGARRRFLKLTLDDFRRAGAELAPADKEKLRGINVALSETTLQFANHVLDATKEFELLITDEKQLAGLPESARAAARQSAKKKGVEGWRFTLQQPSFIAVVTYLDDAALRERIYRAYNTRCAAGAYDNRALIRRILELRNEKARLLGFRNFADLVTDDRMAKSGDTVRRFLTGLEAKTRSAYERETTELLAFRRELEGPSAPPLAAWDVAYYTEKMRRARFDFDEEALRPYFPAPAVVQGAFTLAEKLYGIRIAKVSGVPVWNPAVEYYQLRDKDGTLLGSFYVDLFPRDEKRGGAWTSSIFTGLPTPDGSDPNLSSIALNATPPVGDHPALLTHNEVETLFHEFGHLLHQCLSKVPVRALGGSDVAWDFVELPSQIMENWTWERAGLDLFARHYQTGQPIPEELFQRLRRTRTFRAASAQMRQLSLGTVDLDLHVDYRDGDVLEYSRRVMQRFMPAPLPADYANVAAFSHVFASPVGYASGYYSYKWAEVLDADAFQRFQKEGIFNPATGMDFRRKILERGNSEDPAVLFRDFMGRDPDPTALLRRFGLQN